MGGTQSARRLGTVDTGHPHVDQDEVGLDLGGEVERSLSPIRLAEQLETGRRLDHLPGHLSERRLVINGHDAHEWPAPAQGSR